jgi:hypothetical protein
VPAVADDELTAIEQVEILLRGLRSGRITGFAAAAIGPDNAHQTFLAGADDSTASMRLLGVLEVVKIGLADEYLCESDPLSPGPEAVRDPDAE